MSACVESLEAVRRTLTTHGQEHLLSFADDLDAAALARLLEQIESQDWPLLDELIKTHVKQKPTFEVPTDIEPAPYYASDPSPDRVAHYRAARVAGEQLLRDGKVAAFVVAGGQGTRLGWDGPKGTYPATPLTHKPLFQVFAEYLQKIEQKYGKPVPWYIMTSPANDADTRAFFDKHKHFGLDPADVVFFTQGTMPSIGFDGKVLLEAPDQLALNPDGHGGSLRALHNSGALDDMAHRHIEQISYFQVDNPVVKCVDPMFIGLHALDGAAMSSKMVKKAEPGERVGVFAQVDGRISVIEYSDLPDELAEQRNDDGSLRFNAGSIAIHVIATRFVRELNAGRFALPLHRADKKVSYTDPGTGQRVTPDEPNAVKLESFVFDAVPLGERSIVYEVDRVEEFAPIKNADGSDSPQTSRELQIERAARWLEGMDVDVPRDASGAVDAVIEITPLAAIEADDLMSVELPRSIEQGADVVI